MELSKENQEWLERNKSEFNIAFKDGEVKDVTFYDTSLIERKLLQDQQKIEELEKENAKLKGDFSFNSCDHKFRAHWAHSECEKCGAIHLGNSRQDREDYGIAANKTFRNMAEAKFYQANGFLPEDNKQ